MVQVGMFKIHPEIPESMSKEAKAFILRCFEPDPDRRATALNLLTDEFLTVTSRKKKSKNNLTGPSYPLVPRYCKIMDEKEASYTVTCLLLSNLNTPV